MTAFTPRRHAGRIHYFKSEVIAGREDFAIDVRADGRTVRSYCEMAEGDLTRDASWTLDPSHRPVEGHVRVVQHGRQAGSAWYRFGDGFTECESLTATMGRTTQRLDGDARYLGLHPLVGDGLIALARGTDAPGTERRIESVTCSYDVNGETSLVALPIDIGVTYVGEEDLTVPAGTFRAHRHAIRWQPHWPAAHLWVLGEDAVFVRLQWDFSGLDAQAVRLATGGGAMSPQFDW
ncbi:hypothetical protein [Croceicoccus sp. BE223]|uniref:hypothetical protein n=1 Tax=Croceicoccus sp. BE223 TaxID=2817716 RepID=UPI00285BA786|nr:hypothetical protein [Croceicoccus sp. BE223]MDR7101736.1 hypothetical protein [Croceicoccus sp. BE223]